MKNGMWEMGVGLLILFLVVTDAINMQTALTLSLLAIFGLGAKRMFVRDEPASAALAGQARNTEQIGEKKQQIEKLMTLLHQKGEVTNNDVEQLLGVSDATATRYLSELEAWGHVEQIPDTGRGVVYRLKKTS